VSRSSVADGRRSDEWCGTDRALGFTAVDALAKDRDTVLLHGSDMPHTNITEGRGHQGVSNPIKGRFRDSEHAAKAVERLADHSIPADEVRVFVVDDDGKPKRRIAVREGFGSKRGAIIGGLVGAGLGAVLALLVQADLLSSASIGGLNEAAPFFSVLWVAVAGGAVGVPIGAVVGMGHLLRRQRMTVSPTDPMSVMVIVETRELADEARRILREAGADDVSG
jgi:hypothetical protein